MSVGRVPTHDWIECPRCERQRHDVGACNLCGNLGMLDENAERLHCDCRADDWVEGDNGAIRCEQCGGYAGEPGTSITVADATIYVYAWGNNSRRAELKGRRCVIEIAGGSMRTVLVRFLDTGERVTTSRRALRRAENGQSGAA